MSFFFKKHCPAPEVAEQARVEPVAWRLLEWADGRRRVVCVLKDTRSIRLSSKIVDEKVGAGIEGVVMTTGSGRVYDLREPPVTDSSIRSMLLERSDIDHPGGRDVSDAFWANLSSNTKQEYR